MNAQKALAEALKVIPFPGGPRSEEGRLWCAEQIINALEGYGFTVAAETEIDGG